MKTKSWTFNVLSFSGDIGAGDADAGRLQKYKRRSAASDVSGLQRLKTEGELSDGTA